MTYIIREATTRDTKEISTFVSRRTGKMISPLHIENRLHFMRENPNESLYVYEEENQILGTLGFRIRQSEDDIITFSEISVISIEEDEANSPQAAAGHKLKSYAEQLAQKHACSGMWWINGAENHTDSRKANGFHETGYRFVKRFL